MPTQPTILVKKKDGTSARMTMDEFKDYVRTTKAAKLRTASDLVGEPEIVKPAAKPVVSALSQKSIKSESQPKPWRGEDAKSPLEVGEAKEARKQEVVKTVLPSDRGDAFDAVIRNLKFPAADELRPRLKSLIVSRVKDIRTDEQVIEYATRAVANGGLGLTEAQASELVAAIGGMGKGERWKEERGKMESPKFATKPTVSMDSFPIPHSPFHISRPIMHDIVAPSAPKEEIKASVGPIEELQQLTLTDFRRLSPNPAQAGEILLKKFENLKNESYLLFIKAVQAWYNSPLYRQYQQIIADALNRAVKIKDALGQMKEEEYKAIVKLCSSL